MIAFSIAKKDLDRLVKVPTAGFSGGRSLKLPCFW